MTAGAGVPDPLGTALQTGRTPHEVLRRSVTVELLDVRAELGEVPNAVIEHAAEDAGVTPRTVRRWLQTANADPDFADAPGKLKPRGIKLNDDELELIFAHSGNVSAVWREIKDNDDCRFGSETSLRRAWKDIDPAVAAMAAGGAVELMKKQPRVLSEAPERNHTWRIDHEELPVWVLPKGRSVPEKPWVTVIEDDNTRMAMSMIYTFGTPSVEQIIAALADAIRRKPTTMTGQWVGGLPRRLISDNGGDFRSTLYREALARLGIVPRFNYPYMKHQNGKIERFNRTSQDEFAQRLPGYAHGPETLKGKQLYAMRGDVLHEDVFRELLLNWMQEYNSERPHSSLDGRTPLQVWCEQTNLLREADPDGLRLALMQDAKPRRVQPTGVFFKNRYYQRGALAGWIGRDVVVRYLPTRRSSRCSTRPARGSRPRTRTPNLTEDELDELDQLRRSQYRSARRLIVAAAQRRADAVVTEGKPAITSIAKTLTSDALTNGDAELLELMEQDDPAPRMADDEGDDASADSAQALQAMWELPAAVDDPDDLSLLDDFDNDNDDDNTDNHN